MDQKMKIMVLFIPALLLSILGDIKELSIPDPLMLALWGIALFSIAKFIKRIKVGGDGQ